MLKEETAVDIMQGRSLSVILRSLAIAVLLLISVGRIGGGVSAARTVEPLSICSTPVKIMPVGDSITVGKYSGHDTSNGANGDDIGYRKDLKDQLTALSYTINLIGSQSNGATYPFDDPQHEGYNGITAQQVASCINSSCSFSNPDGQSTSGNWLSNNPPDVILLHIGTNDINNGATASEVRDRVAAILNAINQYEQSTGSPIIVILAQIINQVPNNSTVTSFNNLLATMAQGRSDYNTELFLVNMETGAGLDYRDDSVGGDFIDNLHPYATGYTKMANVWRAKFDELYLGLCENDKPVVTPIPDRTDGEGTAISLQVEANDPDPGDTLTFSATGLPADLSINASTGLISGTIDYEASINSPYSVRVTVSDGKPGSNPYVDFTWTVTNTNRAPVITNPPEDQSNAENETVSLQINASDPDEDSLTFSAVNLPPGLSINASGLISGTITYEAAGSYDVVVTARDSGSPQLKDEARFTWTVTNVNRPPTIDSAPGGMSSFEGQSVNLQILASDPDGDSLTFAAENLPEGLIINPTSGLINGQIGYNAHGSYDVTITVSDDGDPVLSDIHTFVWSVSDANGPPQVTSPVNQISLEGASVQLDIQASDPDGDGLTFSAQGLPPGLTIRKISKYIARISGKIAFGAADGSPYTVVITVTDNGSPSKSATANFTWQVNRSIFNAFLPVIIR